MNELVPRPQDGMRVLRSSDPLAPRLPAKVRRAIDRESAWGIVTAARAQAAGMVVTARIDAAEMAVDGAMLGTERLTLLEASLAKQDPIRAERYSRFVDDFAMFARGQIHDMRRMF